MCSEYIIIYFIKNYQKEKKTVMQKVARNLMNISPFHDTWIPNYIECLYLILINN